MKAALDPFETELDSLFDLKDWHQEKNELIKNPVLKFDSKPTADVGIVSALVLGVIAFVGSWVANKILDEIYEEKLRPAIVIFF